MASLRYRAPERSVRSSAGDLLVLRLGIDQRNPRGCIDRRQDEWFLSWFLGPAEVHDQSGRRTARSGDVIIYGPGDRQRFGSAQGSWRNAYLAVAGAPAALLWAGLPRDRLLHLGDLQAVRYTLRALHHELTRYRQPNPMIVGNLLTNLAAAMVRQLGRDRLQGLPEPVRRAWEHLERQRGDRGLSLATVAREHGLSASALTRLFRRHIGCTPRDALIRLRLERVQELLANAAIGIQEAAVAAGFADHRYLARVVRAHLGCSPTALRERLHAPAAPVTVVERS